MGRQRTRVCADTWYAVFGVCFRIHCIAQRRALHLEGDSAAHLDRVMSWAVFWTDPVNASAQLSVAVTSMLTLIAYRFAVDTQLPRLPYMTRLDVFFLVSTLLVFLSLIEVVITMILDNNDRKKQAQRIDRYCRIIFPAVFLLASIVIFMPGRA
jgi:hypothetical protein